MKGDKKMDCECDVFCFNFYNSGTHHGIRHYDCMPLHDALAQYMQEHCEVIEGMWIVTAHDATGKRNFAGVYKVERSAKFTVTRVE